MGNQQNFHKVSQSKKKGAGKVSLRQTNWKRGTILLLNGFLEALDAIKMKYSVLMVKVKMHRKWYIQGEADERKQNLATVTVGHFSLEKRRLKTALKSQFPTISRYFCMILAFVVDMNIQRF